MCIIAGPVISVSSTNIFVAVNKDLSRQITVYSNEINNKTKNNAMILPVPFADTVELINLSDHKNFFEYCSSMFVCDTIRMFDSGDIVYKSYGRPRSRSLVIHSVGSYLVSIAKNITEIKNVDESVFKLNKDCEKILSDYPNHYGFIICKLAEEKKSYHPFAYSHKIDKNGQFFIPTKHYHAKDTIQSDLLTTRDSKFKKLGGTDSKEHFDHNIYVYGGRSKLMSTLSDEYYINESDSYRLENFLKVYIMLKEFNLGNLSILNNAKHKIPNFNKYKIEGLYENIDFYADIDLNGVGFKVDTTIKEKDTTIKEKDATTENTIKFKSGSITSNLLRCLRGTSKTTTSSTLIPV